MNKTIRYFACTVCICAIGVTITLNAVAVGSCSMTTDKFPFMCAQYPGKYCCSNGQTETNYSCPGGWTLNQSTRQCTRSSVTGSDEKRIHQNRLWFVPGHRNNQLLLWHNDNANIQCGLPIVHGELKGLKMSKKIIVIMGLVLFGFINRANADCTLIGTVYTACKPGYYLAVITCKACPTDEKTGVQTTSPDRNTGGITTCYAPSGASSKDDKGTWVYDGNCYYSAN